MATRVEEGSKEIEAHPETGSELSLKAGAGDMLWAVRKKVWMVGPACDAAICSCQTCSAQSVKAGAGHADDPGTHLEGIFRYEGSRVAESHCLRDGGHAEHANRPAEIANREISGVSRKLN